MVNSAPIKANFYNNSNPYQYNMNQGYSMPMQAQPSIPQQTNPNMYMMNNYSQMPMILGNPHQQQQYDNNPSAGYNQNFGYNNIQQPSFNYQNIPPQQNKAAYPASVLDFF